MLSRKIINSLFPEGAFWEPESETDYDNLLNGIAENSDIVKDDLMDLKCLRDPLCTPMLEDLELEYGVIPVVGATDAEQRERLKITMFSRSELPTYESLENILRDYGFDVYVHANSPAVDPALFLTQSFQMVCGDLLPGGNDAQCGEPEALCAILGGEILVNGEIFIQAPNYIVLCEEAEALCGEPFAIAGNFDSISLGPIIYDIPPDGYWSMVFFVGGPATRDITGALTEIESASIPNERKAEFKRIILQYKVMASWAGLIVSYN
jgi:hypothetical protein